LPRIDALAIAEPPLSGGAGVPGGNAGGRPGTPDAPDVAAGDGESVKPRRGTGLVSGASVGVGACGKVGSVLRPSCVAIPEPPDGADDVWAAQGAEPTQQSSEAIRGVHALVVRSIMLLTTPSWGRRRHDRADQSGRAESTGSSVNKDESN